MSDQQKLTPSVEAASTALDAYYDARHEAFITAIACQQYPTGEKTVRAVDAGQLMREKSTEAFSALDAVLPNLSQIHQSELIRIKERLRLPNDALDGDHLARMGKAVEEAKERLQLGAADKKKRSNRRGATEPKPLTAKQLEAAQLVGEYKGNIAAAAKAVGRDRKTIEQHYKVGLEKLGRKAVKHTTQRVSRDRRGQEDASKDRRKELGL